MASLLEERLFSFLQDNAKDGRILIKLDELCGALNETRGPMHRAINSLAKRRKIKSQSRSRMGLEITIINKTNNNDTQEPLVTNEELDESPISITFYDITSHISSLNLQQLQILKDIVELNIIKKKGMDNDD